MQNPVPAAAETQAAIDTAYDLASKLLAEQHALATTFVAATKQATDATTDASAGSPCSRRPAPDRRAA